MSKHTQRIKMKKSKMKNKAIRSDKYGYFASQKEYTHFLYLLANEKSGVIHGLQRQVAYVLIPRVFYFPETRTYYLAEVGEKLKKSKGAVQLTREQKYIADFVYYKNGELVIEDVKPDYKTEKQEMFYKKTKAYKVFSRKKKIFEKIYKIKIIEV